MNDLIAVCIIFAFIVVSAGLAIYGIVCCIAQCYRHCKSIWQREE